MIPVMSSTGSSSALCRRVGTSVERRVMYQAAMPSSSDVSSAPTMEFVKWSGPSAKSSSASIAT